MILLLHVDVWGLNWTEILQISHLNIRSLSGNVWKSGLSWNKDSWAYLSLNICSGPVPSHIGFACSLSGREAVHLTWRLRASKITLVEAARPS